MKVYTYVILLFIITSCSQLPKDEVTSITANVKNIPAKKVYLTDAYNSSKIFDSSAYADNTFSFIIDSAQSEPFIASILFYDTLQNKMVPLVYQNDIISNDSIRYGYSAFVVDHGETFLSGQYSAKMTIQTEKLKISGGKQLLPFFKTQLTGFGWIASNDSLQRRKIISQYKGLILDYPYSFYFLKSIYEYRTLYQRSELDLLVNSFDREARSFSYYQKLQDYMSETAMPGRPHRIFFLKTATGEKKALFDEAGPVNMIVFWASWCGPCRKEIPLLKEINSTFQGKGLRIVSVSIDENVIRWQTAMKEEAMDWMQLLSDSSQTEAVQNNFNFSAIPLTVFTDKKGLELARVSGYTTEGKDEYLAIINKALAETR